MEMENRNENSCMVVCNYMNHGHVYKSSHHIQYSFETNNLLYSSIHKETIFSYSCKSEWILEKSLFEFPV